MKVLVINLNDLGDVILSTPVVDALALRHEVHFLVDASCAAVIGTHPGVARCWVLPRRDWRERMADPAERAAAMGEALAWADDLRDQRYDVVYNLQGTRLAVELARLAGGRQVRGFIKDDDGLTVSPEGGVMRRMLLGTEGRGGDLLHAAEGFLSVLPAEERPASARLSFHVPAGVSAWAQRTLQGPPKGAGLRLALVPGAGEAGKRWSLPQWRSLIRGWKRLVPQGVAWVLGGPMDRDRGRALAQAAPGVIDLCGANSLEQAAAVMAGCDAVLAGDTGQMHLAAAVGTPTLALFGPTYPENFGPLLPGSLSLRASSGRMDDLSAGAVLRGLMQLTQGRGWKRRAGVELGHGREADAKRIEAAWGWADGMGWLARQQRSGVKVTLHELAQEHCKRAETGGASLEGMALALDLAVESARVMVLWEEKS